MLWTMTSELSGQRQAALRADADGIRQARRARRRRLLARREPTRAAPTPQAAAPRRPTGRLTPRTATCS
jgi:hypothetical protein